MTTQPSPLRPELARLAPYNAGLTVEDVAKRPGVTRIAKLGSNENPLGPDPAIPQALEAALQHIAIYPNPSGRALLKKLATKHGTSADRLVLGNGSEDLLAVLARAVLRPGDRVVTLYPSFPLHEDYARLMGAEVTRIGLTPEGRIDVDALVHAVASPVRLVLFANPMNPAGVWLSPQELGRVLDAVHPETVTCLDEAYHEYAEGDGYASAEARLATHRGPLLILRTFSKAWGLAGLRVGYGLTNNSELKRGLDLVRTPFNVNIMAQVAAEAALDHPQSVAEAVALVQRERPRMQNGIEALGLRVLPSRGNFLFFDAARPAADLAEALLEKGVIVKPWRQPGYETWLRVSVGKKADNDQFLSALATVL
ncbi:histidinol-phosphate transaminase [Brucella inopinata]|uniref:Histidinol-phosphate aminotransferase n=1 Tax=Brucella inopinata TaxID=1218315 RepID=A0AAW7B998_9HYPH|nr:histidinol-phosphate transaminase [Brucella inopinata]EFM56063.1 histidinol-phosphate aminotransferase [Brucella inopinata BO1]KEY04979.1 histidinol-phosphate aminotransferase [Brucella suis bv. 4 str. 40]MDL2333442.1 histidinol-phosphate transaminase [Brucella inopinata]